MERKAGHQVQDGAQIHEYTPNTLEKERVAAFKDYYKLVEASANATGRTTIDIFRKDLVMTATEPMIDDTPKGTQSLHPQIIEPEAERILTHQIPGKGELILFPDQQKAISPLRDDKDIINLTPRQTFYLEAFMSQPNRVHTPNLLESTANNGFIPEESTRAIVYQVKRLRDKLGDDSRAPAIIGTVKGVGYKLVTEHHENGTQGKNHKAAVVVK